MEKETQEEVKQETQCKLGFTKVTCKECLFDTLCNTEEDYFNDEEFDI